MLTHLYHFKSTLNFLQAMDMDMDMEFFFMHSSLKIMQSRNFPHLPHAKFITLILSFPLLYWMTYKCFHPRPESSCVHLNPTCAPIQEITICKFLFFPEQQFSSTLGNTVIFHTKLMNKQHSQLNVSLPLPLYTFLCFRVVVNHQKRVFYSHFLPFSPIEIS